MLPVGLQAPLSGSVDGTKQFRNPQAIVLRGRKKTGVLCIPFGILSGQWPAEQSCQAYHSGQARTGEGEKSGTCLTANNLVSLKIQMAYYHSMAPIYIPSSLVLPTESDLLPEEVP